MTSMIDDVHFRPFEPRRWMAVSLIVGIVWIVCAAIAWIAEPEAFYRGYLIAWLLWWGVALGAMAVAMLHHLMGGRWGYLVRRLGEHAAMTLPMLIVLFIPILIGLRSLYPWARPDSVSADALLRHEQPYLNIPFFVLRFVLYAVVFTAMAWYLRSGSLSHDKTGDVSTALHLHNVSAGGVGIYFILMSFASVDWIMSLEPHWFSTVFGFMIIAGQCISGLCVLIVFCSLMINTPALRDQARKEDFNDLGNLLLTMVILWAYLSFCQLLVIWMGNRQDEIPWYVHRLSGGWWWIGLLLVVLHFFVPFIVLLMRELKRKVPMMLALCVGLLIMRWMDLFWQVDASSEKPLVWLSERFSWVDIVFPIGMGGLWIAMFLWLSLDHPLVPLGDVVAVGKAGALES